MYRFLPMLIFALLLNTASHAQEQCRKCNSIIEDYILVVQDTALTRGQKLETAQDSIQLCEMCARKGGGVCPDFSRFEKCITGNDPSPACLGFPQFEAALNADKQILLYLTTALDSNISDELKRAIASDAAKECAAFKSINTIEFATGRTPCPSMPDYDECSSKGDLTLACLGYSEWKDRLPN